MDFTQPYVLVFFKYTARQLVRYPDTHSEWNDVIQTSTINDKTAIINRYIENGYIPGQLITVTGGNMVQTLYKPLVSNAIVGGTRKNKRTKRSKN